MLVENMFLKGLCCLGMLLFSSQAYSAWSEVSTVDMIYAGYDDGRIFVRLNETNRTNPANCGKSLMVKRDDDPEKAYAMLLTALTTGASVQVLIHDTMCHGNYPLIRQMRIFSPDYLEGGATKVVKAPPDNLQ